MNKQKMALISHHRRDIKSYITRQRKRLWKWGMFDESGVHTDGHKDDVA